MSIFLKNISFHGILLDALFDEKNADWQEVSRLLDEGIRSGAVRPLNSSVFEKDHLEEAFRFMAQGKHIGKVLIKVELIVHIANNSKNDVFLLIFFGKGMALSSGFNVFVGFRCCY
jgi:hypothetical protein